MSNTRSLLADRSVIAVSGDDSAEFLQGLITNDIKKVSTENAIFTALLTPQGKFLFDFFIIEHDSRFLLDVDKTTQADLIKRLTMYKLRSRVEIASLPELKVAAEWGGAEVPEGQIVFRDPRHPDLGIRIIGNVTGENSDHYELHRLSLGVPEGGWDLISNAAFPMQWGYDKLNAIDFNKGCYVGQEVTARSKHIGTMRKMVYKVHADKPLPDNGTPVMADDKEVGKMGSSIGNVGLALLNIEAVTGGAKLTSGGVEIDAKLPEWAK